MVYVVVNLSGGIWPQSPRALKTTRPLGRIAIQVKLELCRLIRNQASGGNCKALKSKKVDINLLTGRFSIHVYTPANEVANDVGVTNNDFITVFSL